MLAPPSGGRSFQTFYRYRPATTPISRSFAGVRRQARGVTDRPLSPDGFPKALLRQPLGSQLYVCGPSGFTDEVLTAAAIGWVAGCARAYRAIFGGRSRARHPRRRLADGTGVEVPSGVSLLEALEKQRGSYPQPVPQGIVASVASTSSAALPSIATSTSPMPSELPTTA